MSASLAQTPIIQCDQDLYVKLASHLQHSIVGKPVFYSDSLVDLVRRHCNDIYAMAEENGYHFIPSDDKEAFNREPIDVRFDVIKITDPD